MYYVFYTFVQIPLEMNLNQKRHLNDVYTESCCLWPKEIIGLAF